jgi:co-chaperonin GroES (HSP10)
MKVARDMILAEEIQEKVSKGGIFIPDTYVDKEKARTRRVKVVAVGRGVANVLPTGELRYLTPSDIAGFPISAGDVLVVTKYVQLVSVNGRELRMFQASDVSAKCEIEE